MRYREIIMLQLKRSVGAGFGGDGFRVRVRVGVGVGILTLTPTRTLSTSRSSGARFRAAHRRRPTSTPRPRCARPGGTAHLRWESGRRLDYPGLARGRLGNGGAEPWSRETPHVPPSGACAVSASTTTGPRMATQVAPRMAPRTAPRIAPVRARRRSLGGCAPRQLTQVQRFGFGSPMLGKGRGRVSAERTCADPYQYR